MPSYYCGIDPGIANMAVCIVQDDPFEIVYLQKLNIFQDGGDYYKFDVSDVTSEILPVLY